MSKNIFFAISFHKNLNSKLKKLQQKLNILFCVELKTITTFIVRYFVVILST